jgi:hypothetical protein
MYVTVHLVHVCSMVLLYPQLVSALTGIHPLGQCTLQGMHNQPCSAAAWRWQTAFAWQLPQGQCSSRHVIRGGGIL